MRYTLTCGALASMMTFGLAVSGCDDGYNPPADQTSPPQTEGSPMQQSPTPNQPGVQPGDDPFAAPPPPADDGLD